MSAVPSALLGFTDNIVLMPGPGADAAKRRADLVRCFGRFEFVPDYTCDLTDLNAGAVCLGYPRANQPASWRVRLRRRLQGSTDRWLRYGTPLNSVAPSWTTRISISLR